MQLNPKSPATVAVAIPSNCRADGVMDQRVGVDGKSYAIGFAIAMPDRWNGRLLFQGGGELNGSVRPPIGAPGGWRGARPRTGFCRGLDR